MGHFVCVRNETRCLGNVAKEILRKAIAKFPKEGVIFFNLACYDCQLGRLDSAKDYLRQASEIDPAWRLQAVEDEDLKPLGLRPQ